MKTLAECLILLVDDTETNLDILVDALAALTELIPHLEARKPKPCAKIMETLRDTPCGQSLRAELTTLETLIRSYKFPQALELARALLAAKASETA